MKLCTKCKQEKPLSEFYVRKDGGHYLQCKDCNKSYKLSDMAKYKRKLYTGAVVTPICKYFGYCKSDVFNSRKKETMLVKFCVYNKLKSQGLSLPQIATVVDKNHASILFVLKKEGFMSEYKRMQLELFQEFDEEVMEKKEIKEKAIKNLYNSVNFKEDQELDRCKRIVKIANLLETSYNEALTIVNDMLEQGFKWIPNYYNSTMMKVIA